MQQKKWMTVTGWVLTAMVSLLLTFSAVMKFLSPPEVTDGFVGKMGYPLSTLKPIGVVEAACVVLLLIPQTAVLGAILVTGYLGGATATHVRVGDPFIGPIIIGVVAWLGLFLRESRLRGLIPIRR